MPQWSTDRKSGQFLNSCAALCSYSPAVFGAGTKLTVLGKKYRLLHVQTLQIEKTLYYIKYRVCATLGQLVWVVLKLVLVSILCYGCSSNRFLSCPCFTVSNQYEAYFGDGTKLTVLGKKSDYSCIIGVELENYAIATERFALKIVFYVDLVQNWQRPDVIIALNTYCWRWFAWFQDTSPEFCRESGLRGWGFDSSVVSVWTTMNKPTLEREQNWRF